MDAKRAILGYQQKCFREYAGAIGLPDNYTYPDGNPIRPLPPVQTTSGKLMIVGAYPSARFEKRPSQNTPGRYRLVPIADNLQPFGLEQYFDGIQVRNLTSADGLDEYLLSPLKLSFTDCWITDLVKVFLYKPEHKNSCNDTMPEFDVQVLRPQYRELARKSLPWLRRECELCKPRLIVTLGLEVAQVVSGKRSAGAETLLGSDIAYPKNLNGLPVLYLPHPDACRRYEKWRDRMKARIEIIRDFLGLQD